VFRPFPLLKSSGFLPFHDTNFGLFDIVKRLCLAFRIPADLFDSQVLRASACSPLVVQKMADDDATVPSRRRFFSLFSSSISHSVPLVLAGVDEARL